MPLHERVRGVNLSGWLVLESWVTPGVFAASGALDERDLVRSLGHDRYRLLVDRHRENFIQEQDFKAIAARGYNAVRIKVPWFLLGDDGPAPGDYVGCAEYVDKAIEWADAAGIDVLLDLALLPGPSGVLAWNAQSSYRAICLEVLAGIAERYAEYDAFLGIEVLDRPVPYQRDGRKPSLHRLRNFYRDAYETIRKAGGDRPIVVLSDAGDPNGWRFFMSRRRYHNVWLDSHQYHYRDNSHAQTLADARELVRDSRKALAAAESSRLPVIVGEWSAALPIADSSLTPEGRIALERVYASEQLTAFSQAQGWFFQTWKTTGKISSWDARIALASFERERLSE